MDYTEEAKIPGQASLSVREITLETDPETYAACLSQAQQHMSESGEEKTGIDTLTSRFFDIEILLKDENGTVQKIEPAAPVSVNIQMSDAPSSSYASAPKQEPGETKQSDPAVLHFGDAGVEQVSSTVTADEDAGEKKDGDSDPDSGAASEGEKTTEVSFEADSFSVYGVIYTVDFEYSVNGKVYRFSLPGGGFVSFTDLVEVLGILDDTYKGENGSENTAESDENAENNAVDEEIEKNDENSETNTRLTLGDVEVSDDTRKFVADVESLKFSSPELVWVGKVNETCSVGALKEANGLNVIYSWELTGEQITEINAQTVEAGDWGLISLQPFDTEEFLTVTMKTGETFVIKVTDAKDAIVIDQQTREIQTIPNPSGTTITMFDYWINTEDAYARLGWPGYTGNGIQNADSNWRWNNQNNNRHGGDNAGINNGHVLKFVPGADNSATDYWVSGGSPGYTWNGRVTGINSWNGTWNNSPVYTGEPTTGIVAGALYSGNNVDENGYPRLNNALGGESLGYLFDPANNSTSASRYRKTYSGVDDFLYVDSDSCYTYDSQYYRVSELDGTSNHFTVSEQPNDNGEEGYLGFWPMGMRNYWFGMHLQTPFSIPADGRVLNPKGEYQPMQFEFAGDDDAWIYIDGILIADGGGIHNRTELDVNFQTGEVLVKGGTYTSITNPNTSVYSRSTIYQEFLEAKNRGEITQAEWDEKYTNTNEKTVWIDTTGDGVPDTFASGTYHTFDFFYLERGGAESNCYLRYNLITTTDFSAHKSYHNEDNPATTTVDESRLARNQYKFELIGFDNPDYASEGDEFVKAIMPDVKVYDTGKPLGTFENPLLNTVQTSGTTVGYQSVILGNTEDGNVNFGDKEISSAYAGKQYKYMVREVVPDNAVNADGVRWADASEELRREGGFVYQGIMYDAKVYYFIGEVRETAPNSGQYELKKHRYLDPEYTQPDTVTKFFSFVNGEETPVSLKVNKKSNDTGAALDGAVFSLTRAMQNADDKWVVREWTINNVTSRSQPVTGTTSGGTLTFSNLMEGHYLLEELEASAGYQMGETHRWLLTLEKKDSENEILLVPYITPLDAEGNTDGDRVALALPDDENIIEYEVLNGPLPPIDLSLEKRWNDNGDTSVPEGAEATFKLHRVKTVPPVTVRLLDARGNNLSEVSAFVGDTIKIYDDGDYGFWHHTEPPAPWMFMFGDQTQTAEDTVSKSDSGWTIKTTRVYRSSNNQITIRSASRSSTGQYTVRQQDVSAGVVELSLNRTYNGATNNYFDIRPKLFSNSAGGSTTTDELISTFTLKAQNGDGDAGNPWKKSFDDLPLVDENGNSYSYYFEEVSHSPANYNIQTVEENMGSASSLLTESGNVLVINNTPEVPKISASKVWQDEAGNEIDAASGLDGLQVRLTLYKGTSPASASDLKEGDVTRTVAGNETAIWKLSDPDADATQYSVRETAVKIPGGDFVDVSSENVFGGTVTGDSANGYVFTNRLPVVDLSVTKEWKDGTAANGDRVFDEVQTIEFTLYQKTGSNDPTVYTAYGTEGKGHISYTPADGAAAAFWSTELISNLPKYIYDADTQSWLAASYYVAETDPGEVTITYANNPDSGVPSETPGDAAVSDDGTITITNTDQLGTFVISKVDSERPNKKLPNAEFKLRKVNAQSPFDYQWGESEAITKASDSEGRIQFTDLAAGYYEVKETKLPDGYINVGEDAFFIHVTGGTVTMVVKSEGSWVESATADDGKFTYAQASGQTEANVTVKNEAGPELPSAGGPGTRIFTLLGGMLIAFAGLLLRKQNRW